MTKFLSKIAFVVCGAVAIWIGHNSLAPKKRYPPGPAGIPLVGNLFQLSKSKPWVHYAHWARTFGDIFRFRVFGREFIVLSSMSTALDLFERRSMIYSDRPVFVMCGELVGRDESVLFSHYGDRLRNYRRTLNSTLGPGVAHRHWELQQKEVHKFLNRLIASPDQLMPAIRRYAGAVVLRIAYGHIVESDDDKYVLLAEELAHITTAAIEPGKWLVDSFPWHLSRVGYPGAGFKTWAANARRRSNELIYSPLREVKKKISDFLESSPASENIIAHTASILATFFLMMAIHPDVQSQAASEIENIIGTSRLPQITDRDKLPFIDALIKETYRFHPVAPLIVHSPLQDDIYQGYLFRKARRTIDPRTIIFGLGRRNCPGRHLGEASVFMAISNTLATLRITKALDAEGKAIEPEVDFTSGHISHPFPFACKIVPRARDSVRILQEALM
ncbi:cytochrome P450 [Mycena vulgaris]|nr:cytochrome P450 [Mycena vulgaris]